MVNMQPSVNYKLIEKSLIASFVRKRERPSHKGDYGHGLLVAGSFGMAGAAVLAAKAALRAGLGLLTVHVPQKIYNIIQISVPEAICSIDSLETVFSGLNSDELNRYKRVAVGPGIGKAPETVVALAKLIRDCDTPMILDADALNIISVNKELLSSIPENSILTPHLKEFSKIVGKQSVSRKEAIKLQIELSINKKVIIVLKGADSSISTPDGELWVNSAGNPGMATAGSGDVLTGVILGLLTQGYDAKQAALAGVYLHSVAGDIAASNIGETSLIASDIVDYIGEAFLKVTKQ
ncbi:MAG: NAD(P)H-hydrate dehydratase [Bacteroidales bacterium]|nr:NAD(P)H-hydrate dehydratase [Bacteroidales bacterium]MDD4657291.1 NAD(P)H-hydrate dehydratase [Bacteroidales bacterium]